MKEMFKLKNFYISFIVFFGIIFLVLVNSSQSYKSEMDILVIFKSEQAVKNAEIITENLRLIPTSLSFYDKVVEDNEDAKDEIIEELPNYKKKEYWNNLVAISRVGKSSVLRIEVIGEDQYMAETLSTQTIKSLIGIVGNFYDIKNDIDIRIIDGPITKSSFSGSFWSPFFKSFFFGFVLAFLLNYLLILFKTGEKNEEIKTLPTWTYRKNEPVFKEKSIKKSEIIQTKKAAAPRNLPVAEDNFPFAEEEALESQEKIPLTHEATPEQVKERLNQLLSGKM